MCGIAGYLSKNSLTNELEWMSEAISHRGPDGKGTESYKFQNWNLGFAHRRLSIIDIQGGHQPFVDHENCFLTFNGEIFNFEVLRKELIDLGVSFVTRSDTEVLFHWLKQFGSNRLHDLNGMFAFAFFDGRKNECILARDRSGIKPLFFSEISQGELVFSSELSSLFASKLIKKEINPLALSQLFYLDSIPAPNTLINGVEKLPPGAFLHWTAQSGISKGVFWKVEEKVSMAQRNKNRSQEDFLHIFKESVRRQMISDVPVGIFLSGGIDSSLVAAVSSKLAEEKLQTFSIGFEESTFDESSQAKEYAAFLGTNHREILFKEEEVLNIFEESMAYMDEPFGDPSFLPTFLLSKFASKHVKVALGGDGGDELFGGYPTYLASRFARFYQMLPLAAKESLLPFLVNQLPVKNAYQSIEWKLKRFVGRWDEDFLIRHLSWMSATDRKTLHRVLKAPLNPLGGLEDWLKPKFHDPCTSLMALDFISYMPGSVLTKVDRASMANAVEVRPPFLDNDLIDFAFSLPSSEKVNASQTKILVREAAASLLPKNILSRKKRGFAIPLASWIRGAFREPLEKILLDSPVYEYINADSIRKIFQDHLEQKVDGSKTLWTLMILDRWCRKYL
jgi:asparagine synthase (glutamine-hydrolysing)